MQEKWVLVMEGTPRTVGGPEQAWIEPRPWPCAARQLQTPAALSKQAGSIPGASSVGKLLEMGPE